MSAVYFSGIKGLKLPWIEHAPDKWAELPPTALFIIDEAQKAFPLRGRGEPPAWIEAITEHRHGGIDFVLITQNPLLIDSYVRRLVERHFHVVRKFGTHFATIHEFTNGVRESVSKSRAGSITHEWRYPKDVFELYHSAEAHTVQRRIPARVWLLLSLPFILGALVYSAWSRLQPSAVAERMGGPGAAPGRSADSVSRGSGSAVTSVMTAVQYVEAHTPRVPGLAYTAPVYDQVTAPSQAPYPAACIASASRCQCYTSQGTRLDVPAELCRSIADGGFFVAWAAAAGAPPPSGGVVPPGGGGHPLSAPGNGRDGGGVPVGMRWERPAGSAVR